jgi:hypothetical protein
MRVHCKMELYTQGAYLLGEAATTSTIDPSVEDVNCNGKI